MSMSSNTSNSYHVGYFEIPANESDRLKSFYSSLFGWQFEKGEREDYWMIKNAGLNGGLAPKQSPEQMPTMFVNVQSIEDHLARARKLGANVVKDRQELSNGYYAVLEDPQKNTIGIWQKK